MVARRAAARLATPRRPVGQRRACLRAIALVGGGAGVGHTAAVCRPATHGGLVRLHAACGERPRPALGAV